MNGVTTPSDEADELACMLRDALCADADEPSDMQRRWSRLLVRIEAPQRRWSRSLAHIEAPQRRWSRSLARIEAPQRRWSRLLARIETPQRLNSMHARSGNQMPCAWLLGWRMISLAHAVS
jgi:hypothetical protein